MPRPYSFSRISSLFLVSLYSSLWTSIRALSIMQSTSTITAPTCNNILSRIRLNDGHSIPFFGLGVYQSRAGGETENAVYTALKEGYRHIDTAEIYRNEEDVGRGIERFMTETGVPREDIYVTTKFFPQGKAGGAVRNALLTSLQKLKLDYVDLYLIHAPRDRKLRVAQWQEMEGLKDEGLARSIGVSNYGIHHLQELFQVARIKPVVNQIEVNPYITRAELAKFCVDNDIVVEAYSPLTKALKLSDPPLVSIASKYSMTPAQVLIRWCLQKGYVVIPKSVQADRIRENAQVFSTEISSEDIGALDALDEYLVTGWDPTRDP